MLVSGAIRAWRGSLPAPVFLFYSGHLEVVEEEGGVPWKKPLYCWLWGIKYALGHEKSLPLLEENPFYVDTVGLICYSSFYLDVYIHV